MLKTILPFVLFAVFVSGCSGAKPNVKTSTDTPKITEDDIGDNKRYQTPSASSADDRSQASQEISPQTGPLETPAPVRPSRANPHRYKIDPASGKGREVGRE